MTYRHLKRQLKVDEVVEGGGRGVRRGGHLVQREPSRIGFCSYYYYYTMSTYFESVQRVSSLFDYSLIYTLNSRCFPVSSPSPTSTCPSLRLESTL